MTNAAPESTDAVAAAAPPDVVSAPVARRGRSQLTRALVCADLAGLVLAMAVVEALYGASGGQGNRLALAVEVATFLVTLPAWLIAAKLFRLYDRDDERADHSTVDDLTSVFMVITVGAWLLFVGATLTHLADPGLVKLVTFWALAIAFVTVGRSIARAVFHRSSAYIQNTVIVGAGDVGQRVARKLMQHREYGIRLVGFVDASPRRMRPGLDDVPVLGPPERLLEIVRERGVERVVVAFSLEPTADLLDTVIAVRRAGVQVDIVPRLFEALGPHVKMHTRRGRPDDRAADGQAVPVLAGAQAHARPRPARWSPGSWCSRSCPTPCGGSSASPPARCSSGRRASAGACASSRSSSSARCAPTPTRPRTRLHRPDDERPRRRIGERPATSSTSQSAVTPVRAAGCGARASTSCRRS